MADQISSPAPRGADAITADTVIEDHRWEGAGLVGRATAAVRATLTWHGIASGEVVVMGCDDARIAALNADFRGKPQATNVLSWPADDPAPRAPGTRPDLPRGDELGDIAIAYDTCMAEAQAQSKPAADHVTHLLVHAVLHLLGYDHHDDADAEMMEATERAILKTLDIPDPYHESDA